MQKRFSLARVHRSCLQHRGHIHTTYGQPLDPGDELFKFALSLPPVPELRRPRPSCTVSATSYTHTLSLFLSLSLSLFPPCLPLPLSLPYSPPCGYMKCPADALGRCIHCHAMHAPCVCVCVPVHVQKLLTNFKGASPPASFCIPAKASPVVPHMQQDVPPAPVPQPTFSIGSMRSAVASMQGPTPRP
jgi:hypothetical protein